MVNKDEYNMKTLAYRSEPFSLWALTDRMTLQPSAGEAQHCVINYGKLLRSGFYYLGLGLS